MLNWKDVTEKIVIAVVAGAILAVGGWFVSNNFLNAQTIEARFFSASIPNPAKEFLNSEEVFKHLTEPTKTEESKLLLARLAASFGFETFKDFNNAYSYSDTLRIVNLELTNTDDQRSGKIEVKIDNGFFLGKKAVVLDGAQTVQLPYVDPNGVELLTMGSSSYGLVSSYDGIDRHVQVLHEGRQVEVTSDVIPDKYYFMTPIIRDYPFLVFMILFMAAALLGLIIVASLVSVLTDKKNEPKKAG
jgi:hypothetical protein